MSLDTLLEAAKYLETIEQNGDVFRSGSSCSGSLSSGGDRSPGGYLRLDPNLPISSQFHDYFCNPLVTGVSFESQFNSSNNKGHKSGSRSSTGRGSTSSTRSRKQTPILISPGKKYTTSESLSEGESAFSGYFENSAGGTSADSLFRQQADSCGSASSSGLSRAGRGSKSGEADSSIRHRELHKTLEKNRRAHLRHCFEELRKELPKSEYSYKKSSHINIIHSAIRYINALKKTEWENEHEIERLARSKIRYQNHLAQVRQDVGTRVTGSSDVMDMMFKSGSASCSTTFSSKSSSPPATASGTASAASPVSESANGLSPPAGYSFSWPRSKATVPGLE